MSERETQNSKIIDGRTSARLGPDRRGGGVTHGGVAGAGAGRGAEYLAEDVLLNQQVRWNQHTEVGNLPVGLALSSVR